MHNTNHKLAANLQLTRSRHEQEPHELLIMGFLFVTAPVSANFMAKVNIHRGVCAPPPAPTNDDTWSTLNVPDADIEIAETET